MEESGVPLLCYHSMQQRPQRAREGFLSDLESKTPHYVTFVVFCLILLSKTTQTCGETFHTTIGKLEWPLPSQYQGWRSPAGSISQWDWLCASVMPLGWVGQGLVAAAAPRLGHGCTPSFCALLPWRKCWQVNLASQTYPGMCSLGLHGIPCVHTGMISAGLQHTGLALKLCPTVTLFHCLQ